ncbi:MAG TPA: hypothetical protein PLP59_13135 [Thermotogota bacterium]|nr:hypothetical protein [Thermotogota bacterium]HPH11066.1 hypothetical protein [Thermotogota bacterium]HQQ67003.1 hypothetical protein [Thermotogota bacterium]
MKQVVIALLIMLLLVSVHAFAQIDKEWYEWCLTSGSTKLWVLTGWTVDGVPLPVPLWAQDNVSIHNRDGTGFFIFGEVDQTTTDSIAVDAFTWNLEEDLLILKDYYFFEREGTAVYKILELCEGKSCLVEETEINGKTVTYGYVYSRYVRPNPYANVENIALTGGETKIWVIESVSIDGTPVSIEWEQDDFRIFCTDGTAFYCHGEILGATQTGINNDRFYWKITDNGTKYVEFDAEGIHQVEAPAQIRILNTERFVFDKEIVKDGEKKVVTVTLVPMFP